MIYHRWSLSLCIHLHFWCACNKSQVDQQWGNAITISVLHMRTNLFSGRGRTTGFNLWDTHYHSVWHAFTLTATVVAKQRPQLRTLKLHTGKIGLRGGGGRDWCRTSRGKRNTWGFNDISMSVVWWRERLQDRNTWRDSNERQQYKWKGDEWDVEKF